MFDRVHPEDFEAFLQSVQEAAKNRDAWYTESRILTKNDQVKWIRGHSIPSVQKDGSCTWNGIFLDITREKKALMDLKESQEKYKLLSEASAELTCLHETDGTYIYVSPSVEKILGFKPEELIGTNPYDLIDDKFKAYIKEKSHSQAEKGQPVDGIEYIIHRKDGKKVWFETYTDVIKDAEGKVIQLITRSREVTKRKETEKALRKSRKEYQLLFNNMNTAFALHKVITDKNNNPIDCQFIDVNPVFENLTGFKRENIIGKRMKELMPETEQYWIDVFGSVALTGKSVELTNYSKEIDGYFETRSYSPRKGYSAVTFFDVTNKIKAEHEQHRLIRKLEKSNHKMEIRNTISNAFIRSSTHDFFQDVLNCILKDFKATFGYFGYINEEGSLVCPTMTSEIYEACKIEGKSIIFPRKSWGGLWGESIIKKKALFQNDNLIVPKGHIQLTNALAVPILYEQDVIGQIVIGNCQKPINEAIRNELEEIGNYLSPLLFDRLRDERQKKQLIEEKERAEYNERMFRSVFEQAEVGIIILDNSFNYVKVNQKYCDMLGYSWPELEKMNLLDITHKEDRDEDAHKIEQIRSGINNNYTHQKRYINKEGNIVWVNAYGTIIPDEDKNIKYVVSVVSDITQQKMAREALIENEKKLKKQNERYLKLNQQLQKSTKRLKDSNNMLKKANNELDSFVYRVSHDLRAPITSSMGLAKLSRSSDDLNEIHKYASLQIESLAKLDNFIKDILNYSRNSRLAIKPEKINFHQLLDDAIRENQFPIKNKSIRLIKEINDDIPYYTDAFRLKIILHNLISNAVKFSLDYMEDPFIKISIFSDGKKTRISIQDNGIGIREEHKKKIFEMFYRGTDKMPGTGIGLYIVKDCIEKIKGKITVESEHGKGSIFLVELPVIRDYQETNK